MGKMPEAQNFLIPPRITLFIQRELGRWCGVGEGGGGEGGFLPVHICLIFIIVARSIALFIQRELGGGGGGGGGGERVRKATITGKSVKVINHSQLLELSLIYIYASFAHD